MKKKEIKKAKTNINSDGPNISLWRTPSTDNRWQPSFYDHSQFHNLKIHVSTPNTYTQLWETFKMLITDQHSMLLKCLPVMNLSLIYIKIFPYKYLPTSYKTIRMPNWYKQNRASYVPRTFINLTFLVQDLLFINLNKS